MKRWDKIGRIPWSPARADDTIAPSLDGERGGLPTVKRLKFISLTRGKPTVQRLDFAKRVEAIGFEWGWVLRSVTMCGLGLELGRKLERRLRMQPIVQCFVCN